MTIEQFGKALAASGLMTADDVRAFWTALPAESRPKTADDFGARLVEKKLLTAYQIQRILAGQGTSLVMGDYAILAEIGAGGMGQVYKARHRRMERIVALKVMSSAAMKDEAAVKRFQREVRAAAKLEHPNIVTAYDSGEAGNVKYLVMQFVDGGDLSSLVKANGPLPVEKAVDYVLQAARGLSFAHAEGVIHRDIKPANLLVDKKGVVKILDMGLARIESSDDGLTATEQVMGTVDYMSPEQAANTKGADGRADIYSLGCTLWYLLTGKKAYEGDTMIARLMAHRDAPLPSLVKTRDDAPWALEQALHKMLAKRPQDRFQSMDEVVAALEPFGGGGGSSKGPMGSSIGGGSQQSAELAAFLQSVGPKPGASGTNLGATKTAMEPKSDATLAPEVTASFVKGDAETDPKSQQLPRGKPLPTPQSKPQPRPVKKKTPPVALIASGVGVLAIALIAGIIVTIKNKDGEVVATLEAPTGATVEVRPTPAASKTPSAVPMRPAAEIIRQLESTDFAWAPPENLGASVNSTQSETFPTLSADELCLIMQMPGQEATSRLVESRRASRNEPFGKWTRLTGSAHEEHPSLSADGLTLFYATQAGSVGGLDIRMRRRASREAPWGPVEKLNNYVNGTSDDCQPWLSSDGLALFFSSTRPGSVGERDIWLCRRKTVNDEFGPAINAGRGINSPQSEHNIQTTADDTTPLFTRNGKPYYGYTSPTGVQTAIELIDFPAGASETWLSTDGERLYYGAALPGGLGSADIWMSRRVPKSSLPAATTPVIAAKTSGPAPGAVAGGWTSLFNGLDLLGWNSVGEKGWSVEDGAIVGRASSPSGWLKSDQTYGDFEIEFEYRLTPESNSGVFLRASGDGNISGKDFHEIQMLDDTAPKFAGVDPKGKTGSLYSKLAAQKSKAAGPNVWHRMSVSAFGERVRVRLNDEQVLDGVLPPGKPSTGHVGFQLYPHEVALRNIRIRPLTPDGAPLAPAAALPKAQEIDLLALIDPRRDRVALPNITKANNWTNTGGKLVYTSDDESGKIVVPIDLADAQDFEINCDVRRIAGRGGITLDFAPSARTWSGLDVDIGSRVQLKTQNNVRREMAAWPASAGDGGRLALRIRKGSAARPGSATISVNGQEIGRWEGDVASLGGPPESHPLFPGTQNLGLFCYRSPRSSFEISGYKLRVFEGEARPLVGGAADDYALEFNGATSYVTVPSLKYDGDHPLTLECTFRPNAATSRAGNGALVGFHGAVSLLEMKDRRTNLLAFQPDLRQTAILEPAPAAEPKLRRLAAVWDGKELTYFIDGIFVDRKPHPEIRKLGESSLIRFMIGASHNFKPHQAPLEWSVGTIDEVRVSKKARYAGTAYSLEPRLSADADTLALYHFDEGSGNVLRDSSGNGHHGEIVAAKWVRADGGPMSSTSAAAAGNHALEFDGQTSYVELPIPVASLSAPLTLEAWIVDDRKQPSPPTRGQSVLALREGAKLIGLHRDDHSFGGFGSGALVTTETAPEQIKFRSQSTATPMPLHVAWVLNEKGDTRVYVNGAEVQGTFSNLASSRFGPASVEPPKQAAALIGAFPLAAAERTAYFSGVVDEVRISKAARYRGGFTPARRLDNDADTIALYHFDEGSGDILRDSSGNGRDGKVVGAKWVRIDGGSEQSGGGQALLFDGVGDHVVPANLTFDPAKPLSIEVDVTPQSDHGNCVIAGAAGQLALRSVNGTFELRARRQVGELFTAKADQPWPAGRRVLVTGVWDGRELTLYVDGRRQGAPVACPPIAAGLGTIVFGATPEGTDAFQGTMHAAKIAFSAAPDGVIASPVVEYRFDEGSGDTVRDITGNGHDGKIVGAKWVSADQGAAQLRNALRLTGGAYVDLANDLVYDGGDVTFETWLIGDKPRWTNTLLAVDHDFAGRRHALRLSRIADQPIIEVARPSEQLIFRFDDTLPAGRPAHLAVVWQGQDLRVYVDGKRLTPRPHKFPFAARPGKPYAWLGGMPADESLTKAQQSCEATLLETRITSRARYDADFTPAAQLTADADTVLLYKFGEGSGDVLHDSSGHGRQAKIVGAKWTKVAGVPGSAPSSGAAPANDYAIDFTGLNGAYFRNRSFEADKPLTMECVVTPTSLPTEGEQWNSSVMNIGKFQVKLFSQPKRGRHSFTCVLEHKDRSLTTIDLGPAVVGRATHFAVSSDGREACCFVDGKLVRRVPITSPLETYPGCGVAAFNPASTTGWTSFPGIVDEVRFSTVARYDQDYVPSTRLEPDADTTLLLHFDEGTGETVRDSSGNGHVATVAGAKWVRVETAPLVASAQPLVFQGHRYLLVSEKLSWTEAKARAEQLGGHLATITSQEEHDWIVTNLLATLPPGIGPWLGATNDGVAGQWRWITGEPFVFQAWRAGEPTNVAHEPAIILATLDPAKPPRWVDIKDDGVGSGDRRGGFIVEWDDAGTNLPEARALKFAGNVDSLVEVPNIPWGRLDTFTVEAWVRSDETAPSDGFVVDRYKSASLNRYDGRWQFTVKKKGKEVPVYASHPRPIPPGRWEHLAGVYQNKTLTLYVDGKRIISNQMPEELEDAEGGRLMFGRGLIGSLRGVRFSNSARYTADFTPAEQLEADADTLALYRFDEGSGDVLRDSSGHNLHGTIKGAEWINLDKGPPAAPGAAAQAPTETPFAAGDLADWIGDPNIWKIENGELVGALADKAQVYLAGGKTYRDVELTCDVKLRGNVNSGVQFRSSVAAGASPVMIGPQLEVGGGGKTGFGGLWWQAPSASHVIQPVATAVYQPLVKADDYNRMTVRCVGKHVTITLNGTTTVDGEFADIPEAGVLGFQLVSHGGPAEIRFRNVKVHDLSAAAATASVSPSRDLLAAIQIPQHVRSGDWQIENGVLRTAVQIVGKPQSVVYLSPEEKVPEEYDLELVVEREEAGGTGMVVGIVTGGAHQATVMMDSYGVPNRWGLENIDGKYLTNGNPTNTPGARLPPGKKKTVRIEVRRTGVRVLVDAEQVFAWQGRPDQLSTAFWKVEKPQSLFLGSQGRFRIHKISLTPR